LPAAPWISRSARSGLHGSVEVQVSQA
jgi:hypothetical protein